MVIKKLANIDLRSSRKVLGGLRALILTPSLGRCGFPVSIEKDVCLRDKKTIQIGRNVYIKQGTQILGDVAIDDDVFIGRFCDIGKNTILSKGVTLADYVCILGDTHDHSNLEKRAGSMYSPGTKMIGEGAWIGYRVLILPQVRHIGKGVVIGAGSVVTKDIPDGAIVAGNPAREIKNKSTALSTRSL